METGLWPRKQRKLRFGNHQPLIYCLLKIERKALLLQRYLCQKDLGLSWFTFIPPPFLIPPYPFLALYDTNPIFFNLFLKSFFTLLNILIPFLIKRFNRLQYQFRDFKCTNIKDFTKFTIISCWRLQPEKERKPQEGWFLLDSRPSKTQVLTWALHGFKLL